MTPVGVVVTTRGRDRVKIYNPATDSWRLDNNLPTDVDPVFLGFFNWNNAIYFATRFDGVYKKTDFGWEKTDIKMGAYFRVDNSPAIIVPTHAIQCPSTIPASTMQPASTPTNLQLKFQMNISSG